MRFRVLACDYDGTLAADGRVDDLTIGALERARASGRTLVLVTGRRLDDLRGVFPRVDLFHRVVAENGGVLFAPGEAREVAIVQAPPESLLVELRRRHVHPLEVGRTIVATRSPNAATVVEAIRDLGLELEIVFNKGAVMVLRSGTTKCTGLLAALQELKLSAHNVVSIGDGENDHALLSASECGVAVASAVAALKETADWTTAGEGGDGVRELIDRLLKDDLAFLEPELRRHEILLGRPNLGQGPPATLRPYATTMLLLGHSTAGKSGLTLGLLERLADQHYQYCLVDPEGDYERMPGALQLGTTTRAPALDEAMQVLDRPDQSVVLCLLAVPQAERPAYMNRLLAALQAPKRTTSRPHWLVVDEAHHVFPSDDDRVEHIQPPAFRGWVMVTIRADSIARAVLQQVNTVVSAGAAAHANVEDFARLTGRPVPSVQPVDLDKGEALVWTVDQPVPQRFDIEPARGDRKRHRRKYAEGELPPERSFYFRGPGNRLHLRAHNLSTFTELSDGVDDETWLHHLHRGDYSRWVTEQLKDDELADELKPLEGDRAQPASVSRARVRQAIERRYAPPA